VRKHHSEEMEMAKKKERAGTKESNAASKAEGSPEGQENGRSQAAAARAFGSAERVRSKPDFDL